MWGVGDTGRNEAATGPAPGVDVSYVRGGDGKEVRGEKGLGGGGEGVCGDAEGFLEEGPP